MKEMSPKGQVQMELWMDRIRRSQASGMTKKAFCEQEGIHIKTYYYWLSKLRKLAVEELPEQKKIRRQDESCFVALPLLEEKKAEPKVI